MKDLPWSYSALSTFEQCPKKFYHLKVAKDVKEEQSEAQTDGQYIHQALFNRVCKGEPLPLPLRHHEDMAAKFANTPGEKHGEMRLALNKALQPVDFFAKDVWVRAVLDLIISRPPVAIVVDWKTGKIKEDFSQLKLTAFILAQTMPEIEQFKLAYVWLRDKHISMLDVYKGNLIATWNEFLPRVQAMQKANKTTSFPAKPGPLCGWCPVTDCPHWIDRRDD